MDSLSLPREASTIAFFDRHPHPNDF